ncbi:MAG: hypothetical protein ABSG65_00725 [Bryobacteraceae bacterium]|jgi:hypothetical protein
MAEFREEQRFEWFWTAMFCVPALLIAYGLYRQVWLNQPFLSDALLWPAFAVAAVVAVWFLRLKLVTEVRADGLYICFVWLWPARTIRWDQIRSVTIRRYRPIREFGGWGVRWDARGIVYHARGNRGARLVLDTGERVLIGSQRADELARAVGKRTGLTVEAS